MALAADEERALARIEDELGRSDPRLAAKLAMFNRLTRSEAMPQRELLTAPGRLRRISRRAGVSAARWRLYPPVPPHGRRTAPPGPAARSHLDGRSTSGRFANLSPRPGHLPSPGRFRRPSRIAAILPVIVTVCAMGAIVAIFSALGHVSAGGATPAPARSCHSVTLAGCQSAAHPKPKR